MTMEDYLYGIDHEFWNSVVEGPVNKEGLTGRKLLASAITLQNDEKKKIQNDVRALRELSSSITNQILVDVQNRVSAKEIWDKIHETYEGSEPYKTNQITNLLTEF